jgi:hypothetical protein
MAFTEIARQSSTVARTTAQTSVTDTRNLPAVPAAGQWVVVALYTNQGFIDGFGVGGANSIVNSVKCGTVTMSLLESGLAPSFYSPTVYIAPYQSGMSTAINVNWTNSVASTTLGIAAMVFTGAVTGITSGYADFRTSSTNGAFDGAGDSTFGFTQAVASSGVIFWPKSSTGIPTNYDIQGEVFIAATTSSIATGVNLPKQNNVLFGAVVESSGNITTSFATSGNFQLTNTTSAATSGKGIIFSPSGNFVFSYTGVSGAILTGCTTTAPVGTVIPTFCQVMLPGTTIATGTMTGIFPTTSTTSGTLGGFQTGNSALYTGTSTANGHVQVSLTGGSAPCRLDLMLGSNVSGALTIPAYANLKIGASTPVGGGFIYTMVPTVRTMTRTAKASRTMTSFFRRKWERLASAVSNRSANSLKTVTANRSSSATHVRAANVGKIANFIRAAKATYVRAANVLKLRLVTKQAKATQVVSASVTKRVSITRRTSATMNYAISSSKSRTLVRRVIATTVGAGRAVIQTFTKTHPGTVTGDFKTASVKGKSQTASVVGDFKTASVSTKAKFLVKD